MSTTILTVQTSEPVSDRLLAQRLARAAAGDALHAGDSIETAHGAVFTLGTATLSTNEVVPTLTETTRQIPSADRWAAFSDQEVSVLRSALDRVGFHVDRNTTDPSALAALDRLLIEARGEDSDRFKAANPR